MVTTNQDYRDQLESERRSRGKRCHFCGCYVKYGEFAHKKHFLAYKGYLGHGSGRGKNHRVIDICLNPDKYSLLCHDCHREYDHKNKFDLR